MKIDSKLEKLLRDIDSTCKPIKNVEPQSCEDVAKNYKKKVTKRKLQKESYKKKDYEKLVFVAYQMYNCLQNAGGIVVEAHSSLTSAKVELHTLQEQSKETISDLLNQSQDAVSTQPDSKCTAMIIEEIKQNRKEINDLKDSVLTEAAKVKSYAEAVGETIAVKSNKIQTKDVVKSLITEFKNNDRKKNLIVYGVDESDRPKLAIDDAFADIGFIGLSFEIEPIGHLVEGKSRPMRVKLSCESTVNSLLRNAHRLKDIGYSNIFLAPERSYQERLARKELVRKLKENITAFPSKKWCIRNGKVVEFSS